MDLSLRALDHTARHNNEYDQVSIDKCWYISNHINDDSLFQASHEELYVCGQPQLAVCIAAGLHPLSYDQRMSQDVQLSVHLDHWLLKVFANMPVFSGMYDFHGIAQHATSGSIINMQSSEVICFVTKLATVFPWTSPIVIITRLGGFFIPSFKLIACTIYFLTFFMTLSLKNSQTHQLFIQVPQMRGSFLSC